MKHRKITSFLFLITQLVALGTCVQVEFQVRRVPNYYTPLDENIYLSGSFNSWSTNNPAYALTRLSFDTFQITLDLAPGATYEYKFTRGSWSNVETLASGEYRPNRQLQIASSASGKITVDVYVDNWEDMKGVHTASGHVYLLESNFPYPQFARTKRMWVYLPPDYFTASGKTYSVLYMHDGQNLFDKFFSGVEWRVDEHLEALVPQGFETSIVVGVETKGLGLSGERLDELTPCTNNTYGGGKADLYLDFLLHNVKPYIDSRFRTRSDRANTFVGGSSLGGLFTFYAGIKNQEVFGRAMVFSPSFWYCESFIYLFASEHPPRFDDFRIYFYGGGSEGRNMINNIVRMESQLRNEGYKHVKYTIDMAGEHHEDFWGQQFTAAYKWLSFLI